MPFARWSVRLLAAGTLILLAAFAASADEPAAKEADAPDKAEANENAQAEAKEQRVTVDAARERARLLHQVYSVTLEVLHERYFHGARAMVPARAMEDIFEELERTDHVKARWISVNTEPMSLNHKPKSDFEKAAADALTEGQPHFERVADGLYQRATPIPLASGCVNCHTGFFKGTPKSPRYAGLVISIPVETP